MEAKAVIDRENLRHGVVLLNASVVHLDSLDRSAIRFGASVIWIVARLWLEAGSGDFGLGWHNLNWTMVR